MREMKADGSLKKGNPEFSYRGSVTGLDRKSGPLDIFKSDRARVISVTIATFVSRSKKRKIQIEVKIAKGATVTDAGSKRAPHHDGQFFRIEFLPR